MVYENLGGRLADTLVSSERWPQIADEMRQMQAAGVDVPQMLRSAAEPGDRVEATLTAAWTEQAARAARLEKETAARAPAGEALRVAGEKQARPAGGKLENRSADLAEVNLSRHENERFARMVGESVEDPHHASVIVTSGRWAEIAATMRDLDSQRQDPAARLAMVSNEIRRQIATGVRRVDVAEVASQALRTPLPSATARATAASGNYAKVAPSASRADGPSAGHSVVVSPDQVRQVAHRIAGVRDSVSAMSLVGGLGLDRERAQAFLSALVKADVIGAYDVKSDRYQVKADSVRAADLLLDGKEKTAAEANRTADASVATATSATSARPQPRSEAVAAVPGRSDAAQTQTKGRAR
ncbi:hypothetical protein IHE61_31250 [Streptomyces sp. GKU 257-1]|nr:hypothetical protein [Streptomyces sp. GKU 257-1]